MTPYPAFSVLLVDDEAAWLRSLKLMLLRTTPINNVLTCQDSREVMALMTLHKVGLVLLDLTMPHIQGDELLARIHSEYPDTLVIILTGLNTVDDAVSCLKAGAFDYYVKTWGEDRLAKGILQAVRVAELEFQSRQVSRGILNQKLTIPEAFSDIVTASQDMCNIFCYIEATAASRHPVLITGESGVGKELIARSIHAVSETGCDFVSVNMASLDDSMLEDTLFGHARGAFTNAQQARGGLAEQAAGGILFMDEIGELSSSSQAKLLRFLQEGEYYPLGSDKPKRLQARIVLATNQDLVARQKDGSFRSDLYYRLKTHHIHVPPLRERKEDIALLTRHFAEQAAKEYGRIPPQISGELMLMLTRYDFPGNVRELQAMITHAVSAGRKSLNRDDFGALFAFSAEEQRGLADENVLLNLFLEMENIPSFSDMKKIMTTAALSKTDGNQTAAARLLGISQPAMSKRMHKA
jgi:DNA-binding NtrC family response regulator